MTVIGINIVGEVRDLLIFSSAKHSGIAVMMFLRVYVLYTQRKIVLGIVIFLFLFQVCMNGWLLTKGEGASFVTL
jgi:hypothetical protein